MVNVSKIRAALLPDWCKWKSVKMGDIWRIQGLIFIHNQKELQLYFLPFKARK